MQASGEKWLTLSEVVHQGNLQESEARRIVNRFGKFLGSRNFGDIVKYPPSVSRAIDLISNLYGQGWGTDDIKEILNETEFSPKDSAYVQLQQEVSQMLAQQEQAMRLMQTTFELVQDLFADIASLTKQLADSDAAMNELAAENRILKKQLGQDVLRYSPRN